MKKLTFIISIFVTIAAQAQIKVANTGNVGIGIATPAYRMHVNISEDNKAVFSSWTNTFIDQTGQDKATCLYPAQSWYLQIGKPNQMIGNIWSYDIHSQNSVIENSDIELQTNISDLENSLTKIMQLQGTQYTWKENVFKNLPKSQKSRYGKTHIGFSAQEVERIFPELVERDSSTGYLGIQYTRMIPILVEAIKQQQEIIDAQTLKIKEIENNIHQSEDSLSAKKTSSQTENTFLYQNTPNPYSKTTEIRFFIHENTKNALLLILDMQGTLITQIPIDSRGLGSVAIPAKKLKAGMYLYTLVCDNTEIATKKMILTE